MVPERRSTDYRMTNQEFGFETPLGYFMLNSVQARENCSFDYDDISVILLSLSC